MTSNPSEEQLEFVTGRIIDIAQAVLPFAMLDADTYFDEAGFDEGLSAVLQERLAAYCGQADDVLPSVEDHPQPRRMARYLLENVDYDVLEAPLPAALLAEAPTTGGPAKGGLIGGTGSDAVLLGYPRHLVIAAAATLLLLLLACIALYLTTGRETADAGAARHRHHGEGFVAGGRGKGAGWRNRSAGAAAP